MQWKTGGELFHGGVSDARWPLFSAPYVVFVVLARVSGARHLVRLGFEIELIAPLARWEIAPVMRYVGEFLLCAVTQQYVDRKGQMAAAVSACKSRNPLGVCWRQTPEIGGP